MIAGCRRGRGRGSLAVEAVKERRGWRLERERESMQSERPAAAGEMQMFRAGG